MDFELLWAKMDGDSLGKEKIEMNRRTVRAVKVRVVFRGSQTDELLKDRRSQKRESREVYEKRGVKGEKENHDIQRSGITTSL